MTLGLEHMVIASTILELNPLLQAIRMIRERNVSQIAVETYFMILAIGSMWFAYALTIMNWPLIIGNGIKLFSSITVIIIYYIFRTRTHDIVS